MMRNIYLEGEMGEKFGTHFYFNAPTVQDALKCLDANFSGLNEPPVTYVSQFLSSRCEGW